MKFKPPQLINLLLLYMAAAVALAAPVKAETVALPITIDYPLLRLIIIKNVFTGPGQSAVVLDKNYGCQKITLTGPELFPKSPLMSLKARIKVRVGAYLLDKCISPVEWEGFIEVTQEPGIDAKWNLKFHTRDSALYNSSGRPAKITGIVYSLVKTHVHEYLDRITINLSPPVGELKKVIKSFFPPEAGASAERFVKSIRPGMVSVSKEAVKVEALADVDDTYVKEEDEKRLSKQEFGQFIDAWEAWDSFLVYLLTSLSKEPLLDDDRQILLDVLLDTRIRFMEELVDDTVKGDFVRKEFAQSWTSLSPVFRRHLDHERSGSVLGFLSFFTATDALAVLDKIGPSLGIEISRNGLLRLARLLNDGKSVPLAYASSVNVKLRQSLGLGDSLDETGPSFDANELDLKQINRVDDNKGSGLPFPWLIRSAWADERVNKKDIYDIKNWIVKQKDLIPYLDKAKTLLKQTAEANLRKSKIPKKYHRLYRTIIPAMAWQESCFRQFKMSRGKVTYLRSYNATSVGIMQINERVWRGVYSVNNLRWNVRYNALAGGEIAGLYLRRYALRKMDKKKPLDEVTLARVVYAMYNGGPGQYRKFLKRKEKGKYYLSDRLFLEKFEWVIQNRWDKVKLCY